MNERDELRGTLSNTICNASNYPPKAMPYLLGGDMSEVLDKTADAILAAGYRKPRTITTAGELRELPYGSIVLDDNGDCELKVNTDQAWLELRTDCAIEDSVNLPVTVLWEPR